MLYLWLKALHVAAVVVWAGGTLMMAYGLGRLQSLPSEARAQAAGLLSRWNAVAVSPAEGIVWLVGLYMIYDGEWWTEGWLHLKLTAAVVIAALRGVMGARLRRTAAGQRGPEQLQGDARLGRIGLIAVLVCIAVIAAMVIVRPF